MKKFVYLLMPVLLWSGMGYAQDMPASSTAGAASTVQSKHASRFQGLWQQRKGHNLRLDYSFQADLLGNGWVDKYAPIRFDLEYQYDIPWNPKRINFYAYAGIVYKQLDIDYHSYAHPYYEQCRLDEEDGIGGYLGIGFKIHCTDWFYLSFAQAFNVMNKVVGITQRDIYSDERLRENMFADVLIGTQTSIRIVGQIKQWAIYFGYRVDRWQRTVVDFDSFIPNRGLYENYLTFGIGYDF